jgi:death on curing protein
MNYFSPQQVLFIHARLIAETGGQTSLRDLALLESAVARPLATFDGADLYPGLFEKAAALLDSLVNNHPFMDGKKRTGITSAGLFLRANGYRLLVTQDELETFTLRVASLHPPLEELASWLKANSQPV